MGISEPMRTITSKTIKESYDSYILFKQSQLSNLKQRISN